MLVKGMSVYEALAGGAEVVGFAAFGADGV